MRWNAARRCSRSRGCPRPSGPTAACSVAPMSTRKNVDFHAASVRVHRHRRLAARQAVVARAVVFAPTGGAVVIAGRDVSDGKAARAHQRQHVQMVFQTPTGAQSAPRRQHRDPGAEATGSTGRNAGARRRAARRDQLPPKHYVDLNARPSCQRQYRTGVCAMPNISSPTMIVSGSTCRAGKPHLLPGWRRLLFDAVHLARPLGGALLCDRVLRCTRAVQTGPTTEVPPRPIPIPAPCCRG